MSEVRSEQEVKPACAHQWVNLTSVDLRCVKCGALDLYKSPDDDAEDEDE